MTYQCILFRPKWVPETFEVDYFAHQWIMSISFICPRVGIWKYLKR